MNKAKLRSYAPQARKDFIAAVTARANLLGLSEKAGKLDVADSQPHGGATVIAGQAWPLKVHSQRQQLIARIEKDGFSQTMEAVAYTWFNRFAALRYMELHDYLGHGYRALSSVENSLPEILTHSTDLAQNGSGNGGLPGLKLALVAEMKLAGNRDGELYRLLLVAQCNALSNIMPFLFERIDDETELLLPDNLLRTDSVIAKLVASIDEEDWKEVEIIGWLYQFYISEKKDEIIGNVVKSEDIPAATQLFTPNWIVQYLVQNSVGRLWLMANQASALKAKWPYYIVPADQTLEVLAQFDALIQTRMNEDGGSLNPETITFLDPACGSGHILVEAYEVFKAIYLERGYQPRSIPRLILEKNLYGLDIDDRAAQMAGFALLMKARADDRRLFNEPVKLNVLSLQESNGLNAAELARALQAPTDGDSAQITSSIAALIATFEQAKTFGSLIQISPALSRELTAMANRLQHALLSGDLYAKGAATALMPLVEQARMLGMRFDAVVANPPYMGSKGMNPTLKHYAKAIFPHSKSDLFAMFIERGFEWCKPTGFNSMVTMQSWMFLSSYEAMRERLLSSRTLSNMVHMGNGVMGIAFGTAATVFWNKHISNYEGSFSYCESGDINQFGMPNRFPAENDRLKTVKPDDFRKIPGAPIAYWLSDAMRRIFERPKLSDFGEAKQGIATADNAQFVRFWPEIDISNAGFGLAPADASQSKKKWYPYNKGGINRRWYGNQEFLVNWQHNGLELKASKSAVVRNPGFFFRESVSWGLITSGGASFRYYPQGFIHDVGGMCYFPKGDYHAVVAMLNSSLYRALAKSINPTVNLQIGDVANLPYGLASPWSNRAAIIAMEAIAISKSDWDSNEISWDFKRLPFCADNKGSDLAAAWGIWETHCLNQLAATKLLEEENNRLFATAYGLQEELTCEVPESQITLARANREKDSQRLLSYAIGCLMGRYSLDEPGLIYANSGNVNFDATRYTKFPADADGIVPLTDEFWFEDDACNRIREFLLAVWGAEPLAKNIAWLAESLGSKAGETPDETIRRYLADKFYKDHLQTYKRRPIYWLFSSGKQGAFQALVYLHRYHEGTLSRMRAEYVVPLTGKIQSRIDMLEKDALVAPSTAARNKLGKEVEKLKKQHIELLAYDEQLRHYADMRITLDLDDGVKANYGKFGDLLAEAKAVTGGANDD